MGSGDTGDTGETEGSGQLEGSHVPRKSPNNRVCVDAQTRPWLQCSVQCVLCSRNVCPSGVSLHKINTTAAAAIGGHWASAIDNGQ